MWLFVKWEKLQEQAIDAKTIDEGFVFNFRFIILHV